MIVTKTPLRVSLVGGGTDLPEFYTSEPGRVVSMTIDKYVYVAVNDKFDGSVRLSYSQTENVDNVHKLKHDIARNALLAFGVESGVEVVTVADIPSAGTGLGSSSAFAVGLLTALAKRTQHSVSSMSIAEMAFNVEHVGCLRAGGKQDQYMAACGGVRALQFGTNGNVTPFSVDIKVGAKETLESHLMLLYTGLTRSAQDVLKNQAKASLSEGTRAALREMKEQVPYVIQAMEDEDMEGLGAMLHEGWALKKSLTDGISTPEIDAWYETARTHGAYGGKILGAGGGGFLLLCAPPDRQREIVRSLPALRHVPFKLEPSGSKIVLG